MFNPFTDYIIQIQKHKFVTYYSKRSNDHTFLLKRLTTTFATLPSFPMAPLKIADTYSLRSTNFKPLSTNTNLKAAASSPQMLHPPHTALIIGLSAHLPSMSSVPTVNPINPSPVIAKNCIVPFVEMNESVVFDRLDHHYTLEDLLHQNDAQLICTMVQTSPSYSL